ncbi:MAG: CPBP family intramembrane glutamic endopeptidase [bacterium]|nr:CPBP family intramembrane glutamic endopeptidase [bacterium]
MLITWGDLYLHGCEPNNKLFEYAAAPVRFDQLYKDPWFIFPILGLSLSLSQLSQTELVQYHLGNGLTKSDLYNDAWKQYYLVGFGEEMFFRGLVLEGFNDSFRAWEFSPNASRHLSIFGSAAVFGLAHNGQGLSANSLSAFASGVYLGYAYMPEVNQREMARVIALHAWWDILISYAYFNNAEFFEGQSKVEIPVATISFRF